MAEEKHRRCEDVLVVVDMQNDFIDGSLGSPDAKAIVPRVVELMDKFAPHHIVLTRDTHGDGYLDTFEGKKLPVPHCIEGTPGCDICEDVLAAFRRNDGKSRNPFVGDALLFHCFVADKKCFGTWRTAEMVDGVMTEDLQGGSPFESTAAIHVCGLCTDICVVSNALILRAAFPNSTIVCHADCCAGTSREAHEAALTVMRSCQIDVV